MPRALRHALPACLAAAVAAPVATAGCAAAPGRAMAGDAWAPGPTYREVAGHIVREALAGRGAWAKLLALCDGIGHRLSGSPQLDAAIAWAVEALHADGHENVRREPVMVPRWVRGEEALHLVSPRPARLDMLGLGMSVGTPPEGVEGAVAVVGDEEALSALAATGHLRGRIVLFNNPMPPWTAAQGSQYGAAVRFRVKGPILAADSGALAVLVRSVTATSLRTPHTGTTTYGDLPPDRRLPAAAVTTEDADLLARLAEAGGDREPPVVRLVMGARDAGQAPSANVVAELVGRERPDEVVVIGGHLDSWDVGQGAHDNGAGCVIAMEALSVLRRLGLRPRRTVRVVLWVNEENGGAGATAYARAHAQELGRHVAAIEADSGGFDPVGFGVDLADDGGEAAAASRLEALLPLLAGLPAPDPAASPAGRRIVTGFSGADVAPLVKAGVPGLGLVVDGRRYFDYHHSAADTVDKVDPTSLARGVAAMAVMAWALAEMPDRLVAEAGPATAAPTPP